MPVVTPPEFLCAGIPAQLQVTGTDGASRCEWEVLDKPVGSQVIFNDDTDPLTFIDVSQDGAYKLRLCCYFDEGIVTEPEDPGLQMNCPIGVIAGDIATVYMTGCEDGTVSWAVNGVAVTGFTGSVNSVLITTDAALSGGVIVSATCSITDIDGNTTDEIRSCSFIVYPADSEVTYTTGPISTSEFVVCGEVCQCADVTLIFDCNEEAECQTAELGIVFIDCPECEEPEECEPLEQLQFLGVETASIAACNDFLECCGEIVCCDPHRPAIFWNSICDCPGWTIDAPAIEGSSIYNACGCNSGTWCFDGPTATIIASGPAQFIDTVVLWGHNISDGSVSTSPLVPFGGGPTGVGVVNDGACIEGYTQPVIINFDQVNESITDIAITITSNTPGPVCIENIFIGQKKFLPNDMLPLSFVNPHDGDDYEDEIKESECGGRLSSSLKQVSCDFSLEICTTDEDMCENWRPFIRYARRKGFMFQWSRNRKPNDIINAWLKDKQPGSTADEFGDVTLTIEASGYISQPQVKTFV